MKWENWKKKENKCRQHDEEDIGREHLPGTRSCSGVLVSGETLVGLFFLAKLGCSEQLVCIWLKIYFMTTSFNFSSSCLCIFSPYILIASYNYQFNYNINIYIFNGARMLLCGNGGVLSLFRGKSGGTSGQGSYLSFGPFGTIGMMWSSMERRRPCSLSCFVSRRSLAGGRMQNSLGVGCRVRPWWRVLE